MKRYDYNDYKSRSADLPDGIYSSFEFRVLVFGGGKFRLYSDGDYFIYENGKSTAYKKSEFKYKWRLYNTKIAKLL